MRKVGALGIAFIGLSAIAAAPGLLLFPTIILGSALTGGERWSAGLFAATALSILPCTVAVALGIWLISNRHRLSVRWFDDTPLDLHSDPASLFRPVVALVGLATSVGAASSVLGSAAGVIQRSATPPIGPSPTPWLTLLPNNAGQLIALVFGLVLVFRSGPIAAWLLRGGDDAEQALPADGGSGTLTSR